MMKENWKIGAELTELEDEFLHGKCIDWVKENYQPNDQIEIFTTQTYDEELDMDVETLIHVCLLREGHYVDIRGNTTDDEKVLEDFYILNEDDVRMYTKQSLEEMNEFFNWIKC